MFGMKKKKYVSIEMNDFLVRVLVSTSTDIRNATIYEYPLPPGVVIDESVQDEAAFFELGKRIVKNCRISRQSLRFFVPDHAMMMRSIDHPKEIVSDQLKQYVEMELGESIHLPFDFPLIDVYDHKEGDGEAVIFAAPSEEIYKLMGIFHNVSLRPTILDSKPLAIIRFLNHLHLFELDETYLIADWSVNSVSLSIYSKGNIDFLRYQSIDSPLAKWSFQTDEIGNNVYQLDGDLSNYQMLLADQAIEIERILNFYQYSLHKGEKSVDRIMMVGDHPQMDFIFHQLEENIETPVTVITDELIQQYYPQFGAKHCALMGLALREEPK